VWGFCRDWWRTRTLAMTRSGNTNVPCEPFRRASVRVAGLKMPKMVRDSGDGNIIGSWPEWKGKRHEISVGLTMMVIL